MKHKIAIIGGDLRIIKLAEMLVKDGNEIYTFGIDNVEGTIQCENIKKALKNVEIVIGPIPFSSNGTTINMPFSDKSLSIRELIHAMNAKILIAGGIAPEVYELANDEYIEIIDIMKREDLN